MSNSVFKKWTNAVLYLNNKIKNNKLIAGRNIQLENTGNGIRIHGSEENNSAGDIYKGAFKTIKDGDNLKVVYGADIANSNCGGFVDLGSNGSSLYIPVISFPVTSANHWITLRLIYNTVSQLYQVEIVMTDNGWADYSDPNAYPLLPFHLAYYSDGTITQLYKISDANYSDFLIDLNGKYWI